MLRSGYGSGPFHCPRRRARFRIEAGGTRNHTDVEEFGAEPHAESLSGVELLGTPRSPFHQSENALTIETSLGRGSVETRGLCCAQ